MFRASSSFLRLAPRAPYGLPVSHAQRLLRLQTQPIPPTQHAARYSSKRDDDAPPPKHPIDRESEKKIGQQVLESRPGEVSVESSVRHVIGEGMPVVKDTTVPDVSSGLKHDIDIVKDTFRLADVPRESRILGLAGTLPYLATSVSTVFLSWNLNRDWPSYNAFYDAIFVNHDTARYLLDILEPIQLGYGAVIISFLGAIHWGLEYAEKSPLPERTRFRYGMGLGASIVAWPTLFMPVEYALTTQFAAFTALYFADTRAATKGWAPYWYGTYRFLLTAMVGLAIVVSLVGRAKVSSQGKRLSSQGLTDSMSSSGIIDHQTDWAKLEDEEKQRIKKEKEEAERKAKKQEQKAKQAKRAKKAGKKDSKDAKAADDDAEDGNDEGSKDLKEDQGKEGSSEEGDENDVGEKSDDKKEKDNEASDEQDTKKHSERDEESDEKATSKEDESKDDEGDESEDSDNKGDDEGDDKEEEVNAENESKDDADDDDKESEKKEKKQDKKKDGKDKK
ncbi:hypothetical protein G7046_g2959 [Stylonectria norvegica]|nr:hypothetical protein G7046_g2959 [Stylonectria norvegica]